MRFATIKVNPLQWLAALFSYWFSVNVTATSIVSLDLCSDWMLLHYAGPQHAIVYSSLLYQHPPDWVTSGLPVHDGRLETLLQLSPDVVVSGRFNAAGLRQRLQQLGVRVEAIDTPQTLQGVHRYIEQITDILQITPPMPMIHSHAGKHMSLLLLGANGIATGSQTFEDGLITRAGFSNYIKQPGFQTVDLERMVMAPPDVLLYTARYAEAPALANQLQHHPALQGMLSPNDATFNRDWRWQCPGPWSFDLLDDLAEWSGS